MARGYYLSLRRLRGRLVRIGPATTGDWTQSVQLFPQTFPAGSRIRPPPHDRPQRQVWENCLPPGWTGAQLVSFGPKTGWDWKVSAQLFPQTYPAGWKTPPATDDRPRRQTWRSRVLSGRAEEPLVSLRPMAAQVGRPAETRDIAGPGRSPDAQSTAMERSARCHSFRWFPGGIANGQRERPTLPVVKTRDTSLTNEKMRVRVPPRVCARVAQLDRALLLSPVPRRKLQPVPRTMVSA